MLLWRGGDISCADATEPGILFRDTVSKTLGQSVKPTEHQQLEGMAWGNLGGAGVVLRAVKVG